MKSTASQLLASSAFHHVTQPCRARCHQNISAQLAAMAAAPATAIAAADVAAAAGADRPAAG
jgi:hypothetical protein